MAAASNANPDRLRPDWGDMQGLVLSAYPHLDRAAYLLWRITDAEQTRRWLARQVEQVTTAFRNRTNRWSRSGGPRNLNIAFTRSGIDALGMDVTSFSQAFLEGMSGSDHRSRILGDVGDNGPERWRWGGRAAPVDVLLMVFASADDPLDAEVDAVSPPAGAMTLVHRIDACPLSEMRGREHFGFVDGMSQPILDGSIDAERFPESIHLTALGEFVLGYKNAWGATAAFGLNGSYLVLRQLEQHVDEFWNFVARTSGRPDMNDPEAEFLAAKMVGRWRDGTPLVPYATLHDNEFGFAEDPYGYGCPLGAHIRRANPRDALENNNVAFHPRNDHRILRRGRSYAYADAPPAVGQPASPVSGERGLMFLCLNADLERQFEFIQQNWINNPAFAGLESEIDPLIGAGAGTSGRYCFTMAGLPAPHRVHDLPHFVTVKGGEYFFLPGIEALEQMAGLA